MSDKPFKPFIETDALTGQPRLITGITDGEVRDPNAPIEDPKGQTITTVSFDNMKVVGRYCPRPEDHNLVPDETEVDFEAVTCTKCPYGALVRAKEAIIK